MMSPMTATIGACTASMRFSALTILDISKACLSRGEGARDTKYNEVLANTRSRREVYWSAPEETVHDVSLHAAAGARAGGRFDIRRDCRRIAPDPRTVPRPPGRRGQQAHSVGQNCRVHEARGRELGPRPVSRAGRDEQWQSLRRDGDQRARYDQEPRSPQGDRAKALFPGRGAERRRARGAL